MCSQRARSLVVAIATAIVPGFALAQDLPKQGEFRITFMATNPVVAKPVQGAANQTHSVGVLIMAAANETGGALLNNMTGRCTFSNVVDIAAKTFENQGFCDYADADGDHVYEKYSYPAQPLSPRAKGTGEWTGGTGKFAGLSGTFEITVTRPASMTEGATQAIGQKKGTYVIKDKVADAK
ncbi:hypothetical protein GMJLKIPL_5925 [Methylobacterium isbiliense]|uniref:Uncharacterized protein n=2 Tax=Methylobacterium isbiliense TaxID=315478 RepID=A0ABQ4SQ62_9HYPH|nr:hypothetical protein GMJLKIPL_5925 [Methylobacterium isbiliense]